MLRAIYVQIDSVAVCFKSVWEKFVRLNSSDDKNSALISPDLERSPAYYLIRELDAAACARGWRNLLLMVCLAPTIRKLGGCLPACFAPTMQAERQEVARKSLRNQLADIDGAYVSSHEGFNSATLAVRKLLPDLSGRLSRIDLAAVHRGDVALAAVEGRLEAEGGDLSMVGAYQML